MTTIMMLALAVVLLLVAVGSLMSYIKERRGYKKNFQKKILTVIHFSRSRGSDT
ncbi:small membrane protein [Klebsiella variicola]|uniref:small membrane protein n=1 Tax=Klebsiella variicola TaxID=244366 RepID=UPI00387987BA